MGVAMSMWAGAGADWDDDRQATTDMLFRSPPGHPKPFYERSDYDTKTNFSSGETITVLVATAEEIARVDAAWPQPTEMQGLTLEVNSGLPNSTLSLSYSRSIACAYYMVTRQRLAAQLLASAHPC